MALKILPVFGRDKEKEVVKLFLKHVEIVEKMALPLQETVDATFKDKNFNLVAEKSKEIWVLERNADIVRKKTATLLYEGAFLPMMRSRLYDFSGRIDDVADTIQDAVNIFHYLKGKKIPINLFKSLHKLGETASKSARLIKPCLQAMFDNKKEEFDKLVGKIKATESEADRYKRELFETILFDKKMDPITVQILMWIGKELSGISDGAKRVSDTMVLLRVMNVA
ncbi:MAG: DUF47 family protein [Nanoarchaeota archaeon]|nr:DUF47 family protein [Nanoarchaeota archaeon]